MRTLVIGASGQVGAALVVALRAHGHAVATTCRTVALPGAERLDLADPLAVSRTVRAARPDAVFCPAGATHVDGCEDDPLAARAANLIGPLAAAEAAPTVPFVYFSTEYVFDGDAGPYAEEAKPRPLSVYGRTKLEAEHALAAFPRALVVRTCGVYGPDPQQKNFVFQVWKRLRAGERVRAPRDQWSTPTFVPDLAATVVDAVARGVAGVVHVAGPESLARDAFARLIATALGFAPDAVEGVTTASLAQKAPRPLRAGLRCARLAPTRAPAEGLAAMRDQLR